jgi:hypothetical protein
MILNISKTISSNMKAYFNIYLLSYERNKNKNNINSLKSEACQKLVSREIHISQKRKKKIKSSL